MTRRPPRGRVLALDLGERRIGVAVSDEHRLTVQRLGVVERVGPKRDARAIRDLVGSREVALVVVGVPLGPDGEETTGSVRAREVGSDLARRLERPCVFADEDGTTDEARERLVALGTRRQRRRVVDDDAAALLLERWLGDQADG